MMTRSPASAPTTEPRIAGPESIRPYLTAGSIALRSSSHLFDPAAMAVKRALDLILAIPLALLSLPVTLAAAITVKLISPGPAFFVQEREGLGSRRIRVWKIRTMVPDAVARLEKLLASDAQARAEWQRYMKLKNDPRVIPYIGRFLRRTSIDELPQLWSVIKGEMSLVGPRVFVNYHLERFPVEFRVIRRQVLPGLTGLWQVTTHSNGDLQAQAEADTYYICNWSIWLDFWILLRTISVVIRGHGAF